MTYRGPARLRLPAFVAGLDQRDWQALAILLAAGLLVRLLAMRVSPMPSDMSNWGAWGQRLLAVGPSRFYNESVPAAAGPAYVYVLGLITALARPGSAGAMFLFRLPAVLADLAIGASIFIAVRQAWPVVAGGASARTRWPAGASLAAALWLLNPAAIMTSAAWGQIDSVYALFLLLSALFLAGSPSASLLSLVLAILVEPRSIELAPLVLVALILLHQPRRLLWPLVSALVLWTALALPYFGWNVFGGVFSLLFRSNNTYQLTALNALSLWAIGGSFKSDLVPVGLGLTPFALGLLLYGAGVWYGVVVLQDQLQRRTESLVVVTLLGAYLLFLPYVVLTRQYDRWLLPVFPFLAIFACLCLRPRATEAARSLTLRFLTAPLLLYLLLTLFFSADLYRVYVQGLSAPAGVPFSFWLYYAIAGAVPVWAVLTVQAFWAFVVLLPWWLLPGLLTRRADREPEPAGVSRSALA